MVNIVVIGEINIVLFDIILKNYNIVYYELFENYKVIYNSAQDIINRDFDYMTELCMNGRHTSTSTIITVKSPKDVPPKIRNNIDYCIIEDDNWLKNGIIKYYDHCRDILNVKDL